MVITMGRNVQYLLLWSKLSWSAPLLLYQRNHASHLCYLDLLATDPVEIDEERISCVYLPDILSRSTSSESTCVNTGPYSSSIYGCSSSDVSGFSRGSSRGFSMASPSCVSL